MYKIKIVNNNLLIFNIITFFSIIIFATVYLFASTSFGAETAANEIFLNDTNNGLRFIGAALSTGFATIGAGIATGQAASAALGALSENQEMMARALIFVALAEGIAIYGLLISFMILRG
jgi:V/A-type H+-transporting ATPase subunit K